MERDRRNRLSVLETRQAHLRRLLTNPRVSEQKRREYADELKSIEEALGRMK
jgi:hypothetical protein